MTDKIKITATSADEWNEIKEQINKLPPDVTGQIERVERNLAGIKCYIKKQYSAPFKLYLPASTTQIQDCSECVTIHCEGFYFEAPKGQYTYVICKQ
jgi:hypothetical protein